MHTTNYTNGFIEIAEDCPEQAGLIPPTKGNKKSVANLQYELLIDKPYQLTSDDLLFTVFAIRKNIPEKELAEARKQFFSKGQPCLRASPLTKRYGWGAHCNSESKVAIFGCETKEYQAFLEDDKLIKKKAMRSKKASK